MDDELSVMDDLVLPAEIRVFVLKRVEAMRTGCNNLLNFVPIKGFDVLLNQRLGKRINIERTEEALATNPDVIASACPFCMTMLTDGVKAKEAESVEVKDVAELILEALNGAEVGATVN